MRLLFSSIMLSRLPRVLCLSTVHPFVLPNSTLCVMLMLSHQVVPNSWRPMDSNPPGSSVHGSFQARVLEWVAVSFSKGSSQPWIESRSPAWQADYLPSEPTGKPQELQKLGANYPDLRRVFRDFSKPPRSKIY